ncbi:DMT family protein [Candidatus Uabimicrobium sp. HlEnr_7]|uniref:DMT family protein n=1 Tax=Candidatus Uabimicrobium helgolandensis TaxID=3095367 RepID=UPI003556351A
MAMYLVPVLLFLSSFLMAFAWLGHIKFKEKSFFTALVLSWLLVLPEYLLNVFAMRWGVDFYKPSEMASINLCTGVICVAIVSKYFLGEVLNTSKTLGFFLMAVGMVLVVL